MPGGPTGATETQRLATRPPAARPQLRAFAYLLDIGLHPVHASEIAANAAYAGTVRGLAYLIRVFIPAPDLEGGGGLPEPVVCLAWRLWRIDLRHRLQPLAPNPRKGRESAPPLEHPPGHRRSTTQDPGKGPT
jgi:hypothetical protein